jgi:serine/threonine-protein kinase
VLISELLDGESLDNVIERQRLPVSHALDILVEILDALNYAHAHGVIHGAVSPPNIVLTSEGGIKLINFGLTKTTDLKVSQNGVGTGFLYYMSPEQVHGAQTLDSRTDLYSCGVVLYELTTGTKPFGGANAFDVMQGHVEQPVASPRSINPSLPPSLNAIILKALAKRPEHRFQSADSFRLAIHGCQQGIDKRDSRHWFRPSLLMATAAGVGGLVVALNVIGIPLRSSPQPPLGAAPVLASPAAQPNAPGTVGAPSPQAVVTPPTPPQSPPSPNASVVSTGRLLSDRHLGAQSAFPASKARRQRLDRPTPTAPVVVAPDARPVATPTADPASNPHVVAPMPSAVLLKEEPPRNAEQPASTTARPETVKSHEKIPLAKVSSALKRLNPFRKRNGAAPSRTEGNRRD